MTILYVCETKKKGEGRNHRKLEPFRKQWREAVFKSEVLRGLGIYQLSPLRANTKINKCIIAI